MKRILVEERSLALFFLVYYLGLLVYGVAMGAEQAIFYALFIGTGALIVGSLYGRTRLSPLVLWGLVFWGLAHMVGGLVEISGEVVYNRSLGGGEFRFDKIVHFFGFGFATLASFEFLITRLPGDSNVGGFSNTGWDLVANTIGAATAALFASRSRASIGAAP